MARVRRGGEGEAGRSITVRPSLLRPGGGEVVPDAWANGGLGGVRVVAPSSIQATTGPRAAMVSAHVTKAPPHTDPHPRAYAHTSH